MNLDSKEVVSEHNPEWKVKKQLDKLEDIDIRNLQRASRGGQFWSAVDQINEENSELRRNPLSLDAARTLSNQLGIDLEDQEGDIEFKEKLRMYGHAGMNYSEIGNHLNMDEDEVRVQYPGDKGIHTTWGRGLMYESGPIIDEAVEGKDARQIAEVLDLDQSKVAEEMKSLGLDGGFTREDTFEATRDYEANRDVDPEAAVYWFLDNNGASSATEMGDFLAEAADFEVGEYEMNQILIGLEGEGRLESELAFDSYTGVDQNRMYSLGFEFGDIELEEGQEELLKEITEYKMQ